MHEMITDKDIRLSNRMIHDFFQLFLSKEFQEAKGEDLDYSRSWRIAHMTMLNTVQIVGLKRGLSPREFELARIAALLHDAYTDRTGLAESHAVKSGEMAKEFLAKYSELSDTEKELIVDAIAQHSEKDRYTDNWLVELMKDADVLDTFLHSDQGYKDKPAAKERLKKVLEDLGIDKFTVYEE
ncbi:HD domain-containing protein [Candidatus Woesearchaeota archaeon]|nr:HD domain-containing protein [Candidatus Woesearchaeota archaeon]